MYILVFSLYILVFSLDMYNVYTMYIQQQHTCIYNCIYYYSCIIIVRLSSLSVVCSRVQEMREQLDVVLQQKISNPRMDLYTPLSPSPPASSQLIQSIIDLIASEDYQWQVYNHTQHVYNSQCQHSYWCSPCCIFGTCPTQGIMHFVYDACAYCCRCETWFLQV